ncbi:PEP-CTERM sorting domain-containing protein [Microcystis sp. M049S2]|jgi:hypothetical protein|uniref:PEP-CTERM sorting domain-containing protein n=1 Tax=Microcystis sp. M049S2 TaxID=2771169 RepID=UPI00259031F6|nr:PEP-CTERM sorting domain-containing protein [Microcystis sp. M049S2]
MKTFGNFFVAASILTFSLSVSAVNAITWKNVSYKETKSNFKWVFDWDGLLGGPENSISPPSNIFWSPLEFKIFDSPNDAGAIIDNYKVTFQHAEGPHSEDINPGTKFEFDFGGAKVADLLGGSGDLLGPGGTIVDHFIGKGGKVTGFHTDTYQLSYKTIVGAGGLNKNQGLRFTATGVHTPEPGSILGLLGLGTLGAASTIKRKLKPSKSSEKETTQVS